MKKLFLIITVLLSFVCCNDDSKQLDDAQPIIQVHFSPRGGVTDSIVTGIDAAHKSVHVHAFAFTSIPIAEALVRAKQRGVDVVAVLDRENLRNPNSVVRKLYNHNIQIYIDSKHAIQHNKVIIIDTVTVFTGSFNLSKGAEENNAENSVAITDRKVAKLYFENFTLHQEHSRPYSPDQ